MYGKYRAEKWIHRVTCITVVKSQIKMWNGNNKTEKSKSPIADIIYVKITKIIIVYIVCQYIPEKTCLWVIHTILRIIVTFRKKGRRREGNIGFSLFIMFSILFFKKSAETNMKYSSICFILVVITIDAYNFFLFSLR